MTLAQAEEALQLLINFDMMQVVMTATMNLR